MSQTVVLFGEALLDELADGQRVLGGAPLNVAWHLQGFGLQPLLISRVGDDAAGEHILQRMQAWGLDCSAVQQDAEYPTAQVQVSLDEQGQPSFKIPENQAFDAIAAQQLPAIPATSWLYHGTLGLRDVRSRATFEQLRARVEQRFIDVNIRLPWWDADYMPELIHSAPWVKVSHKELEMLQGCLGFSGDFPGQQALEYQAQYHCRQLFVTCAAEGAFMMDAEQQVQGTGPLDKAPIVDSLGAGDAFTAVLIYGLLAGWELELFMPRAQAFAEHCCHYPGAIQANPALYEQHLKAWS